MMGYAEIEQLDARLAERSRAEAALHLRLGQALEVAARSACFELGFSSLSAYALERCERSRRWVEGARCLARRLEVLPELRHSVAFGSVSWSKALLVARIAKPSDEARWVEMAQHLTVRQLAARLKEEAALPEDTDEVLADDAGQVRLVCTVDQEEAWLFEATRALLAQLGTSNTDEQLEALLAEAQSTLFDALPRGTIDLDDVNMLDAAHSRWREQLARWRAEVESFCESHLRAQREKEEVGRTSASTRREAPRDSERPSGCKTFPQTQLEQTLLEQTQLEAAHGCATLQGLTPRELDAVVRKLARALAEHELTLSRLILELHRADGWRRLGYASEAQYARERLGMSRSSCVARRALAARLEPASDRVASRRAGLPHIAEALATAHIGIEAALRLVRIATPNTERAWVERAQQRTIKHLQEEVAAALVAVRMSGQSDCMPPAVAEIDSFFELERAVSSGQIFRSAPGDPKSGRPSPVASRGGTPSAPNTPARESEPGCARHGAWHITICSLGEWLSRGVQMCAGHGALLSKATSSRSNVQTCAGSPRSATAHGRHMGRVVLRLRVSRSTQGWWRALESQARRWLPAGMSWLRFCCLSLWQAWRHLLDPDVAYGHIYIRDRHRCTSPVCARRDVTPHHLQFRSAGGSDDDDNITALCTWCHLLGIHGGRIRAVGSARMIRWELGRPGGGCLVVEGRVRQTA